MTPPPRPWRFIPLPPAAALAAALAAAVLAGALAGARPPPAALAGALALLGAALGLTRPFHGLAAAAALALTAPFLIVPQRVGVQPPVLDVVVAAVFAGAAARAIRAPRPAPPSWLIGLVTLGAALPLAAAAWAYATGAADVQAAQLGVKLALYALTPLVVVLARPPRRALQRLAAFVTAAAAAQALAAVALFAAGARGVQLLHGLAAAGYPAADAARFLPDQVTPRATGLLVDPNVLGVTLAAALPFAAHGLHRRRARPTVLRLAALALMLAALALTISRASWIAAAVGLLVLLAVRRPRLACGLAAGLGVLALTLPVEPFARIREGFAASERSGALRLGELREALRVIGRFPLLGIGYGDPPHPDLFAGVSNAWLWLAERAGVGAALAHLALLAGAFRTALVQRRDPVMTPMLASLAGLAAAGLFDHHVVSFPHLVFLLGALLGLIVARARQTPEAAS